MKCSKCGNEFEGKFCPECGTPAGTAKAVSESQTGHNVKICLNCGERLLEKAVKCPACGAKDLSIVNSNDTEQIELIRTNAQHEDKKGFWQKAVEQGREINAAKVAVPKPLSKRERIKENKTNAVACCPKCGSTSLSANKKGFGIGKAAIGMVVTGGLIGAVAGNINAKKVWVTCLNCGHRWKL